MAQITSNTNSSDPRPVSIFVTHMPHDIMVIREKELAEIGDAFKTGLTRKITGARRSRGSETTDCPQENWGH
jgi:hypothetical protein